MSQSVEKAMVATTGRRSIWADLLLYPTHTLPTAAAPILVALGLAQHDGVLRLVPAFAAFLCSWMVHVGGILVDNHELLRRHPDLREHPELNDAIADGSLTFVTLRLAIAVWFGGALLLGAWMFRFAPLPAALLGAVGILASCSYSASRWSQVRLGITDPVFLVMFGIVAVAGTYFVQVAGPSAEHVVSAWEDVHLPLSVFLVGLPVGALIVNVLLIDEIRDRDFDTTKRWRTGAVLHGIGWPRREIWLLTGFAYLCPFAFWLGLGFSAWVLLPLVSLPLAIQVARRVSASDEFADLFPMTPRAAYLSLLYGALLGAGLAL